MRTHEQPTTNDLSTVERLRIVSLPEAARLSGISEDGLRRHFGHKIIRISPRRTGMRLCDALMLSSDNAA